MKVVIAEKPSVAREIAAVLGAKTKENGFLSGNGYCVTWAFGHLIGLAQAKAYGWEHWDKANLPMIPERFLTQPVSEEIKTQLKIISGLFRKAEMIINATDAGREGELIFRYIYEYLQQKDGIRTPFSRLWISSLTDKAIREGFRDIKPGSEYDRVADAAKARSEADWLVGINATVATTLNVGRGTGVWSVGRVQTPTLAMICKRFIENRDFQPTPYFTLQVTAEKEGKVFKANNPVKYEDRKKAEEAIGRVNAAMILKVTKVERKETRQNPPLLYDLTTLQKEANTRFSYAAEKTLQVAQSLYEKKLTTYPRTGSRYIPDDVFALLPELIRNAAEYPRFHETAAALDGARLGRVSVNAAKVTDHHALLPTEKKPAADELAKLTREEVNIYEMIVGRMLETVSLPCIKDVTTVTLLSMTAEDIPFTAKGYIVKQAGWRAVMNIQEEKKEDEEDADLPALAEEGYVQRKEGLVLSKMTKAPALLTENTLLGMMEVAGQKLEDEDAVEAMKEVGIGTPATRAAIIENLLTKAYIVREKKNLVPTAKGLALYDVVREMKISDVLVTGDWEKKLNWICEGKMDTGTFHTEIIEYTRQITDELLKTEINTQGVTTPGQTNCPCPKCRKQNVKFSAKGFAYCPDKECKFILPTTVFGKKLDEKTVIGLIVKGKTQVLKGFKSKSGKKFECALKLNEEYRVVLDLPEQGETVAFGAACPKCGGTETLSLNDARLLCSACDFTVWRERGKHVLTEEELHLLCSGQETQTVKGLVSKDGKKTYEAIFFLDESFKLAMKFPERTPAEEGVPFPGTCPRCHQDTLKLSSTRLYCSCGLKVWRVVCEHLLTEEELGRLVVQGKVAVNGLRSKKGSLFHADLVWKGDYDGTKMVFENSTGGGCKGNKGSGTKYKRK